MSRYHPGLPTTQDAQDNYDNVYSDHVPILATIPFSSDTTPQISILSWNVLERDSLNGFAPAGQSAFGKINEQTKGRYQRIANALVKFAQQHQPDFIALQEIAALNTPICDALRGALNDADLGETHSLYDTIQRAFADNNLSHYLPVKSNEEKIIAYDNCITLYNSNFFEPLLPENKEDLQTPLGGSKTRFKYKGAPEKSVHVNVVNVHVSPNDHPENHETNIRNALSEDPSALSVVVGDFNYTVAPLPGDDSPRTITTNAANSKFRTHKQQGAAAIDGCFFSFPKIENQKKAFKQASIVHLNPETGKAYTQDELTPLQNSSTDEEQTNQDQEVSQLRMCLNVDDAFYKNKKFADHLSIYTYETRLAGAWGNDTKVRFARNLNNESGIGIVINKTLYEYFTKLQRTEKYSFLQLTKGNNFSNGTPCHIVCIPKENIPVFLEFTHDKNLLKEPYELANFLNLINSYKNSDALRSKLLALHEALCKETPNASTRIVRMHFANLTRELKDNSNHTFEDIQKSIMQLDEKLYGKPPMDRTTKAAICGLIGALVGFVIGAIIGGIAFGWGAIPGAITGALIGFTKGTAIGVGVGIASGVGCGIWGYRSADKQKKPYQEQKQNDPNLSIETREVIQAFRYLSLN